MHLATTTKTTTSKQTGKVRWPVSRNENRNILTKHKVEKYTHTHT